MHTLYINTYKVFQKIAQLEVPVRYSYLSWSNQLIKGAINGRAIDKSSNQLMEKLMVEQLIYQLLS